MKNREEQWKENLLKKNLPTLHLECEEKIHVISPSAAQKFSLAKRKFKL